MRHCRPLELTADDIESLTARVERLTHITATGCFMFMGTWEDGKGYKKIKFRQRTLYVHRAMYTALVESIPKGLILDHKCRCPACWNPSHLEPVTVKVNTMRGNGKWIFSQGYTPRSER